ncbi:MAG: hypothetical protein KAU14_06745 [Thermoplasmata archaeon]|nr:hypothetical protein [Thermoplasmata archaeon]
MKVVYFKRCAKSPIHIHAASYASCFYLPDEKIVIFREQHGTFGGKDYSLTEREEILEEARIITEGKTPDVEGVSFSHVKEFEYETSKLLKLIRNAELKAELETKVKAGIEELLKQVE